MSLNSCQSHQNHEPNNKDKQNYPLFSRLKLTLRSDYILLGLNATVRHFDALRDYFEMITNSNRYTPKPEKKTYIWTYVKKIGDRDYSFQMIKEVKGEYRVHKLKIMKPDSDFLEFMGREVQRLGYRILKAEFAYDFYSNTSSNNSYQELYEYLRDHTRLKWRGKSEVLWFRNAVNRNKYQVVEYEHGEELISNENGLRSFYFSKTNNACSKGLMLYEKESEGNGEVYIRLEATLCGPYFKKNKYWYVKEDAFSLSEIPAAEPLKYAVFEDEGLRIWMNGVLGDSKYFEFDYDYNSLRHIILNTRIPDHVH